MKRKILMRGFLFIASILFIGTVFYMNVEGFSPIDAFYFSGSTLTASGYANLNPITPIGKIFTVLYTLVGIGTLFYIMGKLFHILFANTLLDPVFHERHQLYYKKLIDKKFDAEKKKRKAKKK